MPFRYYAPGELLENVDLDQDNEATRDLAAFATEFILGTSYALPSDIFPGAPLPLAVVQSGSALTLTIGGTNQGVLLGGRLVNVCPAVNLTVPSNTSGSPRYDSIAIQYVQTTTMPATRPIENPDTSINPTGSIYSVLESVQYQYVVGSIVAPIGWTTFATVLVPNGASVATDCTVDALFATVAQLIQSFFGDLVISLNGQGGVLSLTSSTGAILVNSPAAGVIQLTFEGVTSVGGLTGTVNVLAGLGISVVASGGNTLTITNTGVTVLNGQTGNMTLVGGAGVAVSSPSLGELEFTNTGVVTLAGIDPINVSSPTGAPVVSFDGIIYDHGAVRRPTAKIVAGFDTTSNPAGLFTIDVTPMGISTIMSVNCTYFDASLTDPVSMAAHAPSGGTVVVSSRFVNNQPPTAAPTIGFFWTVVGY
jgi:hypothetical protein